MCGLTAHCGRHYYAGKTYDFYYNKLGRNSFDNRGATLNPPFITAEITITPSGTEHKWSMGMETAVSSPRCLVRWTWWPMRSSPAVTERTAGSGLRKSTWCIECSSFSDVLGNLVENKNDPKWLLGEDVTTPGIAGDALRSMSNPNEYGQPGHMNEYQNLPNTREGDWGGVHINSGIPNKAFYNFVTHTWHHQRQRRQDLVTVRVTQYLTSYSQFIDARNATIQAATDLFGANSLEANCRSQCLGQRRRRLQRKQRRQRRCLRTKRQHVRGQSHDLRSTYNGLISSPTDVDWFKFTPSKSTYLSLSLTNLPADYDLYLYNSSGTLLARSEYAGTSSESIAGTIQGGATYYVKVVASESIAGTIQGGATYYVKVVGYNGAMSTTKPYALKALIKQHLGIIFHLTWVCLANQVETGLIIRHALNDKDLPSPNRGESKSFFAQKKRERLVGNAQLLPNHPCSSSLRFKVRRTVHLIPVKKISQAPQNSSLLLCVRRPVPRQRSDWPSG
uniref:Peptide Hydrolase n=1 Tax=Thermoactinomyces vulgaris TaxID=2026 RepID=P96143_THEVU|nr:Peptide Hydrolase [Thermoactinomyces vulgaris]